MLTDPSRDERYQRQEGILSDPDAPDTAAEPGPDRGHGPAGVRHRVLIGGSAGVVAASLDDAVRVMQLPARATQHLQHAPAERDAAAEWDTPAAGVAPIVWLDIVRPEEADGAFLRDVLHFHPVPVEDSLHGKQHPKLERYPGYMFLILYAARINAERNRPAFYELHCFVGPNYLVTVRDDSMREVRELMARWRGVPTHFPGVGYLAHALTDAVVDSYFPMVDHFSSRVAATETAAYEHPHDAMRNIMSLRRELLRFRGLTGPTRDVLSSLLRRDLPFLSPDLMPYFQDVRDHAVRVTEEIDMQRDLLSAAVEAQFTVTSNQLNQTMRMLTAWSIILMSMTLIAGIYGMNFLAMPELEWRYGYYLALGGMVIIGGVLVTFFRRRRWL
jgi:magnesium transporter